MAGTVEVVIVGLCTLLNMKNEYKTLPEPSVILVQTGPANGHTERHIPFIAWNSKIVKADFSNNAAFDVKTPDGAGDFRFFELKGERIEIVKDKEGFPDASQMGTIASYFRYRREPVPTN